MRVLTLWWPLPSFLGTLLSRSCTFLMGLSGSLIRHLGSPSLIEHEKWNALAAANRQCLLAAFPRWNTFPDSPKPSRAELKERISLLADLCLAFPATFDLCISLAGAVQDGATFGTWISLAQALHESVSRLNPTLEAEALEQVNKVRGLIRRCIEGGIQQTGDWNLSQDRKAVQTDVDKLVQLSVDIGEPQLCRTLFDSMPPETPCWRLFQVMQAVQKSINEIPSPKDPTRTVL